MKRTSLRDVVHISIGVVIAAAVLQTWFVLGWIVPVTVSGSSMAPALSGPHRTFRCPDCQREFAVGLDQLPLGEKSVCPSCGRRRAIPIESSDSRGARLTVDRTAYAWRTPRRWETVVFRCPVDASDWCVKRVVGLPGETIVLDGGDLVINGKVVRKTLSEQQSMRQAVDVPDDNTEPRITKLGDVACHTSVRWLLNNSCQLEYHHLDNGPITDETSYNQGAAQPPNRVHDIMLTLEARLAGDGQLVLMAANGAGRCEAVVEFSQREVTLRWNDRTVSQRPLPAAAVVNGRLAEWTFSLFDRQVLVAIGDEVVLAEPLERGEVSGTELGQPLAIGVRGLTGEIRRIAVWRDAYYAVRHGDGRQTKRTIVGGVSDADFVWPPYELLTGGSISRSETAPTAAWRLGPAEFFVLGDNAAISDDSRSWLSGPGLDAKLLIGKPLGAR